MEMNINKKHKLLEGKCGWNERFSNMKSSHKPLDNPGTLMQSYKKQEEVSRSRD